jgi:hypothetical protein
MEGSLVTRDELKGIFGNYGGGFASSLVKEGLGRKEYLVGDEWRDSPEGDVRGLRYALDAPIGQVKKVWDFIQENSIQAQKFPNKVLLRLANGRINLFSPWGPRYSYKSRGTEIRAGDPEIDTLEEMGEVIEAVREAGISPTLYIMFADLYGTEINGLPEQAVEDYFRSLKETTEGIVDDCQVTRWSDIRKASRYEELKEEIERDFYYFIGPRTMRGMIRVSANFNPKDPEGAAKRYGVERVAEAIIIDEWLEPIKLSLVRKEKDVLDDPLPRIYVIRNRGPWL